MTDRCGEQLLVDWRTPAAAPFFAATHADPQGLASRRRYRWSQGQVVDFWDESFDGEIAHLALDDDSAFLAGLGASREPRMRDVLGTIAADQDAIIRADSHGASSSTVAPAPARPWSRYTVRRICSTPTRGWRAIAVNYSSWDLTRSTSVTSPTSCPASARTASAPAPCTTSCPKVTVRQTNPIPSSPHSRTASTRSP